MVELRIGLAAAAALLLRASYVLHLARAPLIGAPFFVLTLVLTSGAALVLFGVAALGKVGPRLRWLVLAVCLFDLLLRAGVYIQTAPQPALVTAQSALYAEFASELLVRGENPYAWDYRVVNTLYNVSPNVFALPSDPLPVVYPLPALSFLALVPLQFLQLPAAFTLSLAAYALVIMLIFGAAPSPYQPLAIIPLVIGDALAYSALALAGSLELLLAVVLIGVILLWQRPRLRAILFGCALSLHPLTWLLFPCLLIQLWWTERSHNFVFWGKGQKPLVRNALFPIFVVPQSLLTFTAYTIATFLVFNLPFFVWNPAAWLAALQQMLTLNLPIYAQGLAQLSQFGLLPLPAEFYWLSATVVFFFLLLLLYRHFATMQRLMWLFPALVVWCLPQPASALIVVCLLPTLAALLRSQPLMTVEPRAVYFRVSRTALMGAAAAACLALVGIVNIQQQSTSRFEAEVAYPLRVNTQGRIVEIPLEVVNLSDVAIEPRFSVLASPVSPPQAWSVVGGGVTLAPDERTRLSIRDDDQGFYSAGQVMVEDGIGGQTQTLTLGPYNDYSYPDSVFNGSFALWSATERTPLGWTLASQPSAIAQVEPITLDGKNGLMLLANALSSGLNSASLQTSVLFPIDPMGFWIYVDVPESLNPASLLYGVELQTATRRVLLLYSTESQPPVITPNLYVTRTAVQPRTWVYQEVDFAAIFAEAGWELPSSETITYRDMEGDYARATLRLTVAVTGSVGNVEGIFGPIEQRALYIDPARLMQETFANPRDYYARLAQAHLRMRNYHRAIEAYQTALQYAPHDLELLTLLLRARNAAEAYLPFLDTE